MLSGTKIFFYKAEFIGGFTLSRPNCNKNFTPALVNQNKLKYWCKILLYY